MGKIRLPLTETEGTRGDRGDKACIWTLLFAISFCIISAGALFKASFLTEFYGTKIREADGAVDAAKEALFDATTPPSVSQTFRHIAVIMGSDAGNVINWVFWMLGCAVNGWNFIPPLFEGAFASILGFCLDIMGLISHVITMLSYWYLASKGTVLIGYVYIVELGQLLLSLVGIDF